MNRFIVYLFGFLLLAQANAFALNCDLSKFKLGKNISNFEKEKIAFMLGEPVKGIKSITIPIEFVCQDKGIKGTIISLFFIDEKVVRIIISYTDYINRNVWKK